MDKYEFSIHYKILIVLFLMGITVAIIPPYEDYSHIIIVITCVYIWYQVIRIPSIVTIDNSGIIIFKSLFKTIKISTTDISKIEDNIFTYKILHKNGFINISTLMNNAYTFKRKIESTNSSIESEDISLRNFECIETKKPFIITGYILILTIVSAFVKLFFV